MMQRGGFYGSGNRGGRGGGFYGGSNDPRPSGPLDALKVILSEIGGTEVTEDILQQVFNEFHPTSISIMRHPPNPEVITCFVRFNDPNLAQQAFQARNGRCIFNNMLRMSITLTTSYVPQQRQLPGPGAGPRVGMGGYDQHQQQYPDRQQQMSYNHLGQGGYTPMGGSGVAPLNASVSPVGAGGMMMGGQQQQMSMMPPVMGMPPFNMPFGGLGGGNAPGAYGRFARGRGRGRAADFNRGPGNFNLPQRNCGPVMSPMASAVGAGSNSSSDSPYIAVAKYPTTESLYTLYVLLEAFGGVVTIRRNQKDPEILTGKMASPAEAQNVNRFLRRTPIGGGEISSRSFPTYKEKYTITNNGSDPKDPNLSAYDFSKMPHRAPQHRSNLGPSKEVLISGCAQKTVDDLVMYFSARGINPLKVTKNEDEGTFAVEMDSTAAAISLLITCQGDVCGSEKSNIVFAGMPESAITNNNINNINNLSASGAAGGVGMTLSAGNMGQEGMIAPEVALNGVIGDDENRNDVYVEDNAMN